MTASGTAQKLADITDEGLFERLAMAVLRRAELQYRGLCHTGVNAAGKTIRGPVDGIWFPDTASMVLVHHTTTGRGKLKDKWLHDPDGDLIKASLIAQEEKARSPGLHATLVLTTNQDPSENLVRDVHAVGVARGIDTIDIWSQSRLCGFLDSPDGQWIRRDILGIEQELLSFELLRDLSMRCLDAYAQDLHDAPSLWIARDLDVRLEERARGRVTFVVGSSGSGKSVACYRRLKSHVEAGGVGLVARHEDVASEATLEAAVFATLRRLHRALAPVDPTPFSLCSSESPILLVVEDINHATLPRRLVEKLAGWSLTRAPSAGRSTPPSGGLLAGNNLPPWRILCPAWPEVLLGIQEQVRRELEETIQLTTVFAPDEGRDAVLKREQADNYAVSPLRASEISKAFGHDPLLIALHRPGGQQDAHQVIEEFVDGALSRAASLDLTAGDARQALRLLAREMLRRRQLDLTWREIRTWNSLQGEPLHAITAVARRGEVLRLTGTSADECLSFRHDRVRDWLLSDAVTDMEHQGQFSDDLLQDPYFADAIGAALALGQPTATFVSRVAAENPLALFCAFRLIGSSGSPAYVPIRAAALAWLDGPASKDLLSNAHLKAEVLRVLCETDSPDVLELVGKLGAHGRYADFARLRNGDVTGGIGLCVRLEPGIESSLRDLWIEDAKLRHGDALNDRLGAILGAPAIDGRVRSGALRLAGHIADPRLALAVETCWNNDADRSNRLADYLWAFAECCGADAARLLAPVCDAWGALSDEPVSPGSGSPRSNLAAYGLGWALCRQPPPSAVECLILRARADEALRWPITYMLHGMDLPCAVKFVVHELAAMERRSPGSGRLWGPWRHWRRAQEQGRPMSASSRSMLRELWQDRSNDTILRGLALALWAETTASDDLDILRAVAGSDDLADKYLRERLARGDEQAIPALLDKLRSDSDQNWTWWFSGRHLWSDELTATLDSFLTRRATKPSSKDWGDSWEAGIASELVVRLPQVEADRLLQKHWAHLRFFRPFVQAALYVGTPALLEAVRIAVSECPHPAGLFKHITQHYGCSVRGHPGLLREAQVEALEPYLDFLEPLHVRDLWEACNNHKWFEIRRRLLDERLDPPFLTPGREVEQISVELDKLLAEDHIHFLGHWLDNFLDAGVAWGRLVGWLSAWLDQKRSLKALNLVATAIMLRGTRKDLDVLDACNVLPEKEAKQLVADTRFVVRRSRPR
jgi:hypothetical protein